MNEADLNDMQLLRAALAQRKAQTAHAGEAASILTYLWRTGFFSGHPEGRLPLEMRDRVAAIACAHDGIEQGASSAPSASTAEAPAAPWTPEAIAVLGAAQPVAPAGQAETPKCRFSTGAVNPWSGEKTAGELAGQAAAGVQKDFRAVGWMRSDGSLHKGCPPLDEPSGWVAIGEIIPAPAVERGVEDEQKEFKAAMKKLHHFALPGGSLWDTANVIEKSLMFKAWRAGRSTAGKEQA